MMLYYNYTCMYISKLLNILYLCHNINTNIFKHYFPQWFFTYQFTVTPPSNGMFEVKITKPSYLFDPLKNWLYNLHSLKCLLILHDFLRSDLLIGSQCNIHLHYLTLFIPHSISYNNQEPHLLWLLIQFEHFPSGTLFSRVK